MKESFNKAKNLPLGWMFTPLTPIRLGYTFIHFKKILILFWFQWKRDNTVKIFNFFFFFETPKSELPFYSERLLRK